MSGRSGGRSTANHFAAAEADARPLVLALPKGRILEEVMPLLARAGIRPEADFADPESRQLRFRTRSPAELPAIEIIRVRSFDVATFVAFGAAALGVVGSDVLMEFDYPEVYAPVDLKLGRCRLAVAEPAALSKADDPTRWSHIRVATKYPEITRRHFAARGVQAECIRLSGAMELAPTLGLCRRIVDLVSSGRTLMANNLVEVEHIADVSARLVVNRGALKTDPEGVGLWVERIRESVDAL
jgi:ATP phosphoribosyltransferase